jgi:hypothetical protein
MNRLVGWHEAPVRYRRKIIWFLIDDPTFHFKETVAAPKASHFDPAKMKFLLCDVGG